jgi:hypothetical protein
MAAATVQRAVQDSPERACCFFVHRCFSLEKIAAQPAFRCALRGKPLPGNLHSMQRIRETGGGLPHTAEKLA